MENNLFRKYKFKFYLNASHSVIFNGRQGEVHPHTWEFTLVILIRRDEILEFTRFEKATERVFERYQNRTVNEVEPFNTIIPTLENLVEHFGATLQGTIREQGGELLQIEGSETPSRSYIISYIQSDDYTSNVAHYNENALSSALDHLLDDIL